MFVSVDLPIPGDPPSSTSDPGTIPPPSTRSSSPIPVDSRGTGAVSTSASGRGRAAAARRPEAEATAVGAASSTIVFHSLHPGHCPCQRGVGGRTRSTHGWWWGGASGERLYGPEPDGKAPA